MMSPEVNILQAFVYLLPIFSALACILVLYKSEQVGEKLADKKVLTLLFFYLLCFVFIWGGTFFYVFYPQWFIVFSSVHYLSYVVLQVVFYHITFTITHLESDKFSYWHYVPPFVLAITLLVCSFFIPFEKQLEVVNSRGGIVEGYEAFSTLANSRHLVRAVYSVVYLALGIYRFWRYRKEVDNISADEEKASLNWMYLFLGLSFILLILPFMVVFIPRQTLMDSLTLYVPICLIVIQQVVLCYYTTTGQYVLLYTTEENDEGQETGIQEVYNIADLNRQKFERYIYSNKPYLKHDLKITDITAPLQTNRTYLSTFINRNYGMNFSHFINTCRLNELEELLEKTSNRKYDNLDLILRAGFGSYNSYLRAKKRQQEKQMLKVE